MSSLKRTTPLRAQPRSKGNRAEREIIDILHRFGWKTARRNFQSGGQGGGDIIEGPPDVHLEVKHRERLALWEWIAQAEGECRPTDTAAVVFRRNRSQWYVAVPFEAFLCLLKEPETPAIAVESVGKKAAPEIASSEPRSLATEDPEEVAR